MSVRLASTKTRQVCLSERDKSNTLGNILTYKNETGVSSSWLDMVSSDKVERIDKPQ